MVSHLKTPLSLFLLQIAIEPKREPQVSISTRSCDSNSALQIASESSLHRKYTERISGDAEGRQAKPKSQLFSTWINLLRKTLARQKSDSGCDNKLEDLMTYSRARQKCYFPSLCSIWGGWNESSGNFLGFVGEEFNFYFTKGNKNGVRVLHRELRLFTY